MGRLNSSQLQHLLTVDPTGILYQIVKSHQEAINNLGSQTNAQPVGSTQAPPQISRITATPKGGGVHQVTIFDNNPVQRGIRYFAEYSADPNFSTFSVVAMSTSRQIDVPAGTGDLFWRAYSQYPTSPPSLPVYHGGTIPVAVNSTGATASAAAGIPGTGSGTDQNLQPQGGSGFGINPDRSPKLPL